MSIAPLAIIAGAGPGLGQALGEVFAHRGYHAVGLRRSEDEPDANRNAGAGASLIRSCDLTDQKEVEATIRSLADTYGPPHLVVHNPAHLVIKPFFETTLSDFSQSWHKMVLSAAVLAQATFPLMLMAGKGTFIVSGATASQRGGRHFSAFASAKFALRGLTQALAREFQPQGIHVIHAILDGIIDTADSRARHEMDPARMMQPKAIAAEYLRFAQQDRSVWSHEVDLRPDREGF